MMERKIEELANACGYVVVTEAYEGDEIFVKADEIVKVEKYLSDTPPASIMITLKNGNACPIVENLETFFTKLHNA